jgi:hypothetical protein
MHTLGRTGIALALAAAVGGGSAGSAGAAPIGTCTAGLFIRTTSVGTVTQAGPVTIYRDSGVGGAYTSGFLAGYTITGAQTIIVNSASGQSEVAGQFVATGAGGTLQVRYTGRVDQATGAATGQFSATEGTGGFASFRWTGTISGQQIPGVPAFNVVDTGLCSPTP